MIVYFNLVDIVFLSLIPELYKIDPVQVSPVHPAACFRLDYSVLYSAICDQLNDERTTLLLYLLLHQHQPFRNYVYTHADIQTMVNFHNVFINLIIKYYISVIGHSSFACAIQRR